MTKERAPLLRWSAHIYFPFLPQRSLIRGEEKTNVSSDNAFASKPKSQAKGHASKPVALNLPTPSSRQSVDSAAFHPKRLQSHGSLVGFPPRKCMEVRDAAAPWISLEADFEESGLWTEAARGKISQGMDKAPKAADPKTCAPKRGLARPEHMSGFR